MPEYPVRQPTRAPGFDYRDPGPYFITICEYRRINRFGTVIDSQMHLNPAGLTVVNRARTSSRFMMDQRANRFGGLPKGGWVSTLPVSILSTWLRVA